MAGLKVSRQLAFFHQIGVNSGTLENGATFSTFLGAAGPEDELAMLRQAVRDTGDRARWKHRRYSLLYISTVRGRQEEGPPYYPLFPCQTSAVGKATACC